MSAARSQDSVSQYLRSIGRCPPLDRETEQALAARAADGDRRATEQLVRACLPFVVRIARDYQAWGAPLEDLIQQGNLGLVKAAAKFEPGRDTRLATYASYWIRAEIRQYVVNNYRSVRLGATATERRAIRAFRRRPIETPEELAELSGMPVKRAKKLWPLLERGDVALDRPTATGTTRIELMQNEDAANPEHEAMRSDELGKLRSGLEGALAKLTDREREIVTARIMADEPRSLRELGAQMGLSRERVRQIELRSKRKLAGELKRSAA